MFRKSLFYDDLSANMIPPALLLSMFAVSSRFAGTSCYADSGSSTQPQEYFDAAYKGFRQEMDRNRPVELNDVKAACLLALFDYTSAPSRRAWLLVRDAMSLALAARLHEIDSLDSLLDFSDPEKEERRFVWWTVWKVDCTVNVSTVTPFGIDCRMIGTALVSTTVQNFTANALGPIVPVIPEMDPVKSWSSILGPNLQDTGDGFNTHLYAVSLLRAVSECQQRLNAKLCPEEISRADTLNRILSSLHLILPDYFFSPTKRLMEQEHAHRLRLETNIMLNTFVYFSLDLLYLLHLLTCQTTSARLILHEPTRQIVTAMDVSSDSTSTSLKSWKESIGFARNIASLFDHWQFSYSAYADPVISCALWHAYCGLRLYGMSGLDESGSSFSSPAAISLDKLRLSLESFTPWWPIARVLRGMHQSAQTAVPIIKLSSNYNYVNSEDSG
ncbi:Transcription factor [Penicillium cf. griseofulvum]|nr:Transcription factor [Penicillium cf. griseofulvum]